MSKVIYDDEEWLKKLDQLDLEQASTEIKKIRDRWKDNHYHGAETLTLAIEFINKAIKEHSNE